MSKKTFLIGLTGGIGAGKTEACIILANLGAYIIDADIVSRSISSEGGSGYYALKNEFPNFFDDNGKLMRTQLREHIFLNKLTDRLNEIMLPLIVDEIETLVCNSEERIIVLVAPLLIESGLNNLCDVTITITAERKKRIERIMSRDNMDINLAQSMIDSQLDDEERKKHSDIVIINNYGKEDLERKVKYYYEKIQSNLEEDN